MSEATRSQVQCESRCSCRGRIRQRCSGANVAQKGGLVAEDIINPYHYRQCEGVLTKQRLEVRVKHRQWLKEGLILHGVTITHPDRIVFEEGRITKGRCGSILCGRRALPPARNTRRPIR